MTAPGQTKPLNMDEAVACLKPPFLPNPNNVVLIFPGDPALLI